MEWKEILYWFSDVSIMSILDIIRKDFLIMVFMFGGAVVYLVKKFTSWTPWTSDDDIADKIGKYFGLNKKEEDKKE